MQPTRRLAAIMFTDIVGYTAMMGKDEQVAIKTVTHHKKLMEELVPKFDGDLIQFYGDGSLSIYQSATRALECAMEIQHKINAPLRIGIHIGEILLREGSIYGDGVNVASRIESLGQAGAILFSEDVFQKIRNNKFFKAQSLGRFEFKNVEVPMQVYALANEGMTVPNKESVTGKIKAPSVIPEHNKKQEPSQSVVSKNSIAVLPFTNMSSDPEQEFFCEGISEEIINTIVQLPELTVVGRTSSFCFKGKNEDLRSVGDALGVGKILEGSVRKSGNRIRITAQLVEASSGFHLWSKKYDRELIDIFQIQDEISSEIAHQLTITLSGAQPRLKSRAQTASIEAYQLYYKGRSFYYQRGMSLFEALKHFQAALKIDPNYALAHSGLADTYIMLCFHGYLSPSECWNEAIPAAKKALDHGPDLGETHNTQAIIAMLHDRNLEVAEYEFNKALEINPTHDQARVWYGLFYLTLTLGKYTEGIEQCRIAINNDPLSSYVHSCTSIAYLVSDQVEDALSSSEYAVQLDSNSFIARYALCDSYLWTGRLTEALEECRKALKMSSRHAWSLHLIAITYLKLGRENEALKIYKEMETRYRDHYLPPSNLAIVAAALGNDEFALELVKKAIDIIDPYLPYVALRLKDSQALRNIPGFDKIQDQLGFSQLKENR